MTELQQTKNMFKFIGTVTRLDRDNAFREAVAERGKHEGDTYRSLRFGIKTSPTNEMTVSMYDFEPKEVFLWNSEKKKADKSYKGDRVPFQEWLEKKDELRAQGYAVLQTRVGLEFDEKGEVITQGMPSFVASKYLYDNLTNGDPVQVEGEIRYSTYENKQGKTVEQKTYTIKKLIRKKNIDFDAPNFEEVTYYEQEFVFVDADLEKENKQDNKVYVTGRTIDYMKNWHDTQFVLDCSDTTDEEDSRMMKKLATAFLKKFKFGDVVTVWGDALNRVIVEEVEEDSEEDLLASLGGRKKPKHAQHYAAKTYISEARINGVDDWERKVYTEDDFVKDELVEKDDKLREELGGRVKKKIKNPFEDDDDMFDINEDSLPF